MTSRRCAYLSTAYHAAAAPSLPSAATLLTPKGSAGRPAAFPTSHTHAVFSLSPAHHVPALLTVHYIFALLPCHRTACPVSRYLSMWHAALRSVGA
jgi:hypothetical protein